MPAIPAEDVIILLDTSRSMLRRDFAPSRLNVTIRALGQMITKKFQIDANDRIGLVTFGSKAQKLQEPSPSAGVLTSALKITVEAGGGSEISDGLALSIQALGSEMRKIGGKVARIMLFSDDKLGSMTNRLIKLANAAKGLGIFIDCLVAGGSHRMQTSGNYSVMKNLAMITGGDFAYFSNANAYANAVTNLSSKKDLNDINGYWQAQETARAAPLLSEIAVELRRPTVDEIQSLIADPNKIKCNICHRSTSPTGQVPFVSLRYCPSCGRPMHLQCAQQWAKNAPDATENVFRCPFCYFLIRDSTSTILSRIAKVNAQAQAQATQATTFILVPSDKVPDIEGSCANCRIIFMGEYDVYKCRSCGSYYHAPCVKEIQEKYKACRICGRPIQNIDQIVH